MSSFEKVKGLMASADLFDIAKLPETERARYGPGTFGLHTLMARNLVEQGAPFVMVANGMPWDNHVFQYEIHQMLVPELDRIVHHLVTDLQERGLLDHTLVIAMGEFGRTPWLNAARGRDHYPHAWSLMMTGCGLKRGVIVGGTDADGVRSRRTLVQRAKSFRDDLHGARARSVRGVRSAGSAHVSSRGRSRRTDSGVAGMKLENRAISNCPRACSASRRRRTARGSLPRAWMDKSSRSIPPRAGDPFFDKHRSFASGCVLLPDGKTLISAGYDGWLLWHDLETRARISASAGA
jgi:hypothetical protein